MTVTPLVSTVRFRLKAAIEAADPIAKVHAERRNARLPEDFATLYIVGNQTHAWEIEYNPTQPPAREDDAGDLYYRIHSFLIHFWFGPYNEGDETGIDAADILHEVFDAIEANPTIFDLPEITERTVTSHGILLEKFHYAQHHHGTLEVQITATQVKAS